MKRNALLYLLIISCLIFQNKVTNAQNIYEKIDATKCDSLIKANAENPNFVILDVRTYGEWVGDHLEGSINRSTRDSDFEQQLDKLPKHKTFLIHCKSGGRSASAFAKMQNLGFAEVYEMKGGINAWKSRGYSTTSELAPKLMLVSFTDSVSKESNSDTIHITITNRANELLTFNSATFSDLHDITHNFDETKKIEGAEDYTFSIYHSPGYIDDDTTKIFIDSNGGTLELDIAFKSVIQNNHTIPVNELIIYPNPAKNRIYFNNLQAFTDIEIYNLAGQLLLKNHTVSIAKSIDISGLNNGQYIIYMRSKNKTFSKLFIVSK
ncbi:MAG: rhodanese-like domain-containing protein [Draconibacterium sp.]|nr:rhodanese-like domain-containing protein [Draconibacterium sp.]